MDLRINRRGTGPIGLHMGLESLRLLQMERGKKGLCIRACDTQPYPQNREELLNSPRLFRSFIKKSLYKKKYRGSKIVTCLPLGNTQIVPVTFSLPGNEDEAEAVLKTVRPKLPGGADEYVIDYIPIRGKEVHSSTRSALVVADKRKDIIRYLDLLTEAGLDVLALDFAPAALRRLIVSFDKEKKYPAVLLINFCSAMSYVTFVSGRRLVLDREVGFGAKHFIDRVGSALDIDAEKARELFVTYGVRSGEEKKNPKDIGPEVSQALAEILKPIFLKVAEEVNKLLLYAASETQGETVEKVYLMGSIARIPGVQTTLRAGLSIPCEVLDPLKKIPTADTVVTCGEERYVNVALAAGLALRGFLNE
ncbi:MAG: pilus assembly protein PilM [Nitrospinota bacterium]